MADKDKANLGCLEEDDEFEEFPVEEWTGSKEDEDGVNVWEDNWDDDNVEEDFNNQLKADKDKANLGCLEEDDEFEEFPVEEWTRSKEDQDDVNVWEDNWDDNNVENDFNNQLRAQLESQKK